MFHHMLIAFCGMVVAAVCATGEIVPEYAAWEVHGPALPVDWNGVIAIQVQRLQLFRWSVCTS